MQDADKSCVTVMYEFSAMVDKVQVEDSGIIEIQDGMWHLKGEAYEIFTDAQTTWVLDPESKEAIAEPAWTMDDLESFYSSAVSASGYKNTLHPGLRKETCILFHTVFFQGMDIDRPSLEGFQNKSV